MGMNGLFLAFSVGCFGAGCASLSQPTAPARRFDTSLYVKAQQPELSQLDPALRTCVPSGEPVTVTWHIAGDGHVEDVTVAEPTAPSAREHDCILSRAFSAKFAAPANGKSLKVTHAVSEADPVQTLSSRD